MRTILALCVTLLSVSSAWAASPGVTIEVTPVFEVIEMNVAADDTAPLGIHDLIVVNQTADPELWSASVCVGCLTITA